MFWGEVGCLKIRGLCGEDYHPAWGVGAMGRLGGCGPMDRGGAGAECPRTWEAKEAKVPGSLNCLGRNGAWEAWMPGE